MISILIVFISINFVGASDNATNSPTVSEVTLNTSDMDLLGENLLYNATLNSLDNASLENQTIIFSVNGINYTKLTNMNGTAFLNIRLNNGIYPISTAFADVNGNKIVNNNTIYVSKVDGTLIKDNLSGPEIQRIIDDANDGDTLIFAGSNYYDVSVNVNKSLNIISIVKSVFKGNNNGPVIKISADNVNISDLVISSAPIGILIDNANNAAISSNSIINDDNGIRVLNSNNTLIFNNNITNSRSIGIYLKNSLNTNISYNTLLSNYEGIYFDSGVSETQIYSNYISKTQTNAINLAKSGSHTNISYNILERNEEGIFIDMAGDEGLNIDYNTIQRNNDNGIYFGENYRKTDDNAVLNIGNNSIVYNTQFNILARDSIYTKIDMNKNWIASDNPRFDGVCSKVKFPKYHLNINQIDGNTMSVSVDGIKTSSVLRVSYNGGKNWKSVTLVNGQANIAVSNEDGNVMFDYFEENSNYQYQMENYVAPTPEKPADPVTPEPATPENNDSPADSDNSGSGNGTDSGSEKTEGNGTTTNPNSGSSQGQSVTNAENSNSAIEEVSSQNSESSSSQPASQAVSSASTPQSVSKQISDPSESIAKVLNIDEEVVRIAGMGFILLLIIAVIAVYYRDDVKYMLNRRNEH